jgi:CRISPR system Cascade subunit CasA
MLFIDSAGAQTARNNADLMVRRGRYPSLDLPLAAMALYAFQAHAPSGGAGNRTSMRGGGPMVTLVEPVDDGGGLWSVLWANVPCGHPAALEHLPWMQPARTSEGGRQVFPHQAPAAEAFFGMPRRLRLIGDADGVVGVVQKPYGTNYAGWVHPLTPHYRQKPGAELLPVHPRPGHFGYRNWLGTVAAMPGGGLRERARTVAGWRERAVGRPARVIVAGWAMDNMKPRDFILSRAPLIDLPERKAILLSGMVQAAELYGVALRGALRTVLAEGEAREAAREEFFIRTQDAFEARLRALSTPDDGDGEELCLATARDWLGDMQAVAMAIFESQALPGLPDRRPEEQKAIVDAHRGLRSAFAGYGKIGGDAWGKLDIPPPETKKGRAAA